MRNIFGKPGVYSRVELARAVERADSAGNAAVSASRSRRPPGKSRQVRTEMHDTARTEAGGVD